MTKKNFIALADLIKRVKSDRPESAFTGYQILALAALCREENPRFDLSRWLSYIAGECGPNGGTVKG